MDIKSLIDNEDGSRDGKPVRRSPALSHERPLETRDGYIRQDNTKSSQHSLPSPRYTSDHQPRLVNISPHTQNTVQQPREGISPSYVRSPSGTHYYDSRLSATTPTHPQLNPPTPLTATPTASTPGSANGFSHWPRPDSSHSASTPTFANSISQHYFRDSPRGQVSPSSTTVQKSPKRQQMSPNSAQQPSAPPLMHRTSYDAFQSPSNSIAHKRKLSSEPLAPNVRLKAQEPLTGLAGQNGFRRPSDNASTLSDRQQSLSVSPKTQSSGLPNAEHWSSFERQQAVPLEHPLRQFPGPAKDPAFAIPQAPRTSARRTSSMGIDSMLNAAPSEDLRHQYAQQLRNSDSRSSLLDGTQYNRDSSGSSFAGKEATQDTSHPASQSESLVSQDSVTTRTSPPQSQAQSHIASFASIPEAQPASSKAASDVTASLKRPFQATSPVKPEPKSDLHVMAPGDPATTFVSADEPVRKRTRIDSVTPTETEQKASAEVSVTEITPPRPPRFKEPPIWARSVRPKANGRPNSFQLPSTRPAPRAKEAQVNGATPLTQSLKGSFGPLGELEPSLVNEWPAADITEFVSNELFFCVLQNYKDVGVAPLSGPTGSEAVLEIEAKLGRIIDRNTMDRLQIPVETETVIRRGDPSLRLQFESSMTQKQHASLNAFLNKALTATLQPTKMEQGRIAGERVRMGYKHTKETDTFYQLPRHSQDILPGYLRDAKVRITRDLQGMEVAKILKAKQMDYDILCPRYQVDFRISISVEKQYTGSTADLIEIESGQRGPSHRFKDRMSYSHQQCHFDLTQVHSPKDTQQAHKDHELEVEVSSQDVREQAQLLKEGKPNSYADLIRNFVNNVRTLAKAVPKDVPNMIYR